MGAAQKGKACKKGPQKIWTRRFSGCSLHLPRQLRQAGMQLSSRFSTPASALQLLGSAEAQLGQGTGTEPDPLALATEPERCTETDKSSNPTSAKPQLSWPPHKTRSIHQSHHWCLRNSLRAPRYHPAGAMGPGQPLVCLLEKRCKEEEALKLGSHPCT